MSSLLDQDGVGGGGAGRRVKQRDLLRYWKGFQFGCMGRTVRSYISYLILLQIVIYKKSTRFHFFDSFILLILTCSSMFNFICACVNVSHIGWWISLYYLQKRSLNPFTATGCYRSPMLNRNSKQRGEIKLLESERIFQKFQLEPEI